MFEGEIYTVSEERTRERKMENWWFLGFSRWLRCIHACVKFDDPSSFELWLLNFLGGNSMWALDPQKKKLSRAVSAINYVLCRMCWFSFDSFGKWNAFFFGAIATTKVAMWAICNWILSLRFYQCATTNETSTWIYVISKREIKENFQFELSYRAEIHLKFVHLQSTQCAHRRSAHSHRDSWAVCFPVFTSNLMI